MKAIKDYLDALDDVEKRAKFIEIIDWISKKYPQLSLTYKWNQPTFMLDKTFILALAHSKHHLSISPEAYTINYFKQELEEAGYKPKKMTFSIPWKQSIDYPLLARIIELNIKDKEGYLSYWRKDNNPN